MLGLGFGLTNFGFKGGVSDTPDLSGSSAAAFLALWSTDGQGLVMDFADDQSIKIVDTSTPANDIDSSGIVDAGALVGPGKKLTLTSPSTKLCRQQSGLYARQAHNLYLNSAAPANQSVTVVSGATYRMTITGSVSITVSGAATGTYTAGDNDFTAATTTLTCGSTSGSGTVHLHRTPSNSDYVATSGSAVYALPYEWNTSGECQGVLIEPAATNLCTYSNDLTKSAWLTIYGQGGSDPTTQVTTAKTATGISGVANSATTVTASQNNAWIHQLVSAASAAHTNTVFLKRRTGTGAVTIAIGEKTGSELITNGDFASDVSGWTNWGGGSIAFSSGTAAVTTDGSFQGAYQAITCTVGKLYAVSADVSVANGRIYINDAVNNSSTILNTSVIAAGTSVKYYFVANATTMYVLLSSASASTTANYDNVSVKEISETTVDLSSGGWVRGTIENKTVQNPIVGIKLATSGDAIDVQYGQIEATSYATSPIETFATSLSRNVDNVSMASSGFPVSTTAMTFFAQGKKTTIGDFASTPRIFQYDDGTAANRALAAYTSTTNIQTGSQYASGGQYAENNTITSATDSNKVAMRIKIDDCRSAVNGTLSAQDTTFPTWPTGLTTLRVGSANSSAAPNCGYIQKLAVFPTTSADATLQSMST